MAVTLEIPITDDEQAIIIQMAEVVAPGMTPIQVKEWCEAEAKRLLRERILSIFYDKQRTDMQAAKEATFSAWPDPQAPT